MAYMSQEKKQQLAPAIKKVLAKYNMKGTLGVNHSSTLVLNIKSGPLDIVGQYNARGAKRAELYGDKWHSVDHCDVHTNDAKEYTGQESEFIKEIVAVMNVGNWDNSDIQTDYFDVGWYTTIHVGNWDKPYALIA